VHQTRSHLARLAEGARAVRRLQARTRVRAGRFEEFGARSMILPPARIDGAEHIRLGRDVTIGVHAFLSVTAEHHGRAYDPHLTIGDRCSFGDQLFISCCGHLTIGQDVLGSARVFITDTYHDYRDRERPPLRQPLVDPQQVTIGNGVFLGVGCCVLPGVTIGERAYVGANAVVTQNVEPWTVVAGNPARLIRHIR
jgi:acetyltransferase-like isoleucine patch superfamily enzyme